uniref:Ribonuclease A-domain domain-containing protein n=1 Tax=Amphilophus citrinellus TaxID=61819 RepID=A0A3Q0R623_AMPCI
TKIPTTPAERLKFKRQHVDAKMTANDCNKKISCRNIYKNDNSCKTTNTFILSDEKTVKSICQGEGRYDSKSGMTYSKKHFRIVKCKLKSRGGRKPHCQYRGKRFTNRTIAVRCDEGLPVHYSDNDIDLITLGKENNKEIKKYVIVS